MTEWHLLNALTRSRWNWRWFLLSSFYNPQYSVWYKSQSLFSFSSGKTQQKWMLTLQIQTLSVSTLRQPCDWFGTLQWRNNERDGISNHQCLDCLLNLLFRCRLKKTSKLCVTHLCEGNSLVTGEFPAQRASNTENVFIWWPHELRGKLLAAGNLVLIYWYLDSGQFQVQGSIPSVL